MLEDEDLRRRALQIVAVLAPDHTSSVEVLNRTRAVVTAMGDAQFDRQAVVNVVGQLPGSPEDAMKVLALAEELIEGWLSPRQRMHSLRLIRSGALPSEM